MMLVSALAFGAEHGGGGEAGGEGYVKMEPMVVNLSDHRYIQFIAEIKPKKSKDGKAEGAEMIPTYMPMIRHEMLKNMIGKEADKVQTPEFMEGFSKTTAALINKLLDGDLVEAVFFQSWIVQ
jgi:flagellar basal body-associated protein FliL